MPQHVVDVVEKGPFQGGPLLLFGDVLQKGQEESLVAQADGLAAHGQRQIDGVAFPVGQ